MKNKIPYQFELCGLTIKIEWSDKMLVNEDYVGLAKYSENKIVIQKNNSGVYRSTDNMQITYLHELIHWILYMMGENELRNNEKFVDLRGTYEEV